MTTKQLCIIGCGTYGSYLLKRLLETTGPEVSITVVEVGGEQTKSESEIGYVSASKNSKAPSLGRYFGLGGTSARWGGQLLFFDKRDNLAQDPDWAKIIELNQRHKGLVLDRILGGQRPKAFEEGDVGEVKTGIWLKYFKRNLYQHLDKKALGLVEILTGLRAVGIEEKDGKVAALLCLDAAGTARRVEADRFYLTAGAIESYRLLQVFDQGRGYLKDTDLGKNYGDHVSIELFRVKGKPVLDGTDFTYKVHRGNLITKRIVVHSSDGKTGYLHFIFNKEVKVFSSIKSLLFGKMQFTFALKEIMLGIPFLLQTAFAYIFLKKLHADQYWSLQLDMEQSVPNGHRLSLLPGNKDRFGEPGIAVDWSVTPDDLVSLREIAAKAEALLQKNGLSYEPLFGSSASTDKVEDIYHPVGFIRMGSDARAVVGMDCRVRGYENLFHFSTALFPSAKSINPTAAGFCLVEEQVSGGSG